MCIKIRSVIFFVIFRRRSPPHHDCGSQQHVEVVPYCEPQNSNRNQPLLNVHALTSKGKIFAKSGLEMKSF